MATATPAPESTPVLTITAIIDRQFIAINGAHYDLRNPSDLSIRDHVFMDDAVPRFARMIRAIKDGDPSESLEVEAGRLLDRIITIALDAPAALQAQLSKAHKLSIVGAFLRLPIDVLAATEAPLDASLAPKTGDSWLPASPDSTVATPSAGTNGSPST